MSEIQTVCRDAGEILLVGVHGLEPSREMGELLKDLAPGGIILFSRNIQDAAQTAALTRWLGGEGALPRILAVDQEGGRVERLRPILGRLPDANRLGLRGPAAVRQFGHLLGEALRGLGFNLNFAPVLDLSEPGASSGIGDRSFGTDPGRVAELGRSLLAGFHQAGVLGVAKHFPGLGPTAVDSHLGLPRVDKDESVFRAEDLVPFRECLSAAPAVMMGHAHYPFLDPEPRPASLSRTAVQGLLRGELGYAGVVFTDDLEMQALDQGAGWLDAALSALEAGCDQLLVCHSLPRMVQLRDEIVRRVEAGSLSRSRLEEAAARVRNLRRGLPRTPPSRPFSEARAALRETFGMERGAQDAPPAGPDPPTA